MASISGGKQVWHRERLLFRKQDFDIINHKPAPGIVPFRHELDSAFAVDLLVGRDIQKENVIVTGDKIIAGNCKFRFFPLCLGEGGNATEDTDTVDFDLHQ